MQTNRLPQGTGSSREPRRAQIPQGTLPWGSFKASQNLLLAFFTWKALQAFKALQAGKGVQALKALGFLQVFSKFAFGVLYLESFARLQSVASWERSASFESFGVPSKLPIICFWRSLFGKLCKPSKLSKLGKECKLRKLWVPSTLPKIAFGVLYLESLACL